MEENTFPRSVIGLSKLEYIMQLAKRFKYTEFTFEEARQEIIRESQKIEKDRERYVKARRYRYKEPVSMVTATKKAIEALEKRWSLIEKVDENKYLPLDKFAKIGEALEKGNVESAKLQLFDTILSSQKELPFCPSRFFIGLRNYVTEELRFQSKFVHGLGKKAKEKLPKYLTKKIEREEGIAYWPDENFIHTHPVHSNTFSLTVISDWGEFFSFLEKFPDRIYLDRKYYVQGQKFFLVRNLATISELLGVANFLGKQNLISLISTKLELTRYAASHIAFCANKLVEVLPTNDIKEILNETMAKGGTCIDVRGLISEYNKEVEKEDPNRIFVVFKEKVGLNRFVAEICLNYSQAIKAKPTPTGYIPISTLKGMVCKKLRINSREFDELFEETHEKFRSPLISLAHASYDTLRSMPIAHCKKAAILIRGRTYHLVNLEGLRDKLQF